MVRKQAFLVLTVVALASCGRAKTLSSAELRSNLASSISLASETDIFAGQIEEGRLLPAFQSGHAAYLRSEAKREAKGLRKSSPQPSQLQVVRLCIEQLDLLSRELELISQKKGGDKDLPAVRQRVQAILKSLTAAKAGL